MAYYYSMVNLHGYVTVVALVIMMMLLLLCRDCTVVPPGQGEYYSVMLS